VIDTKRRNSGTKPASRPNIVFVLMDNVGYGEPGCYGGGITRGAPTPRIDTLAAEGTRLLNFNVEAQCTPSRSAIMTGRFSIRSGTHSVPMGGGLDGLTQWKPPSPSSCPTWDMPPAISANGIWAATREACLTLTASTSGTASRPPAARRT